MATASRSGAWEPLKHRAFAILVSANLASNIGTWIQNVGEKWQMAELTRSPLLISLIETGTTLPILFLALSAGALADITDRRKLLLVAQTYMLFVAAGLSALTFAHLITPTVLIIMSLLLGVGSALTQPAWQAIVPELLPKEQIANGVALNSAGFNVSRAVGPAVGGLIVGIIGPAWAFALNSLSFLAVVGALWQWKRAVPTRDLPGERFLGAVKVGLRYARHSRPLQIILWRAVAFVFFTGIIFSLLPSLAIHHLKTSSEGFGFLLGCIGAGAVAATTFLPRLRARMATNRLLLAFHLIAVAGIAGLGFSTRSWMAAVALFACGMSWLSVLSTVNTAIQLSVPSWVKARAFGCYTMAWGGALAVGATFWGAVAMRLGIRAAFIASGAGLLLATLLVHRLRIEALDHEPDMTPHRAAPHPDSGIDLEAGPILIQLEYRIPVARHEAFREAMHEVRRIRKRDGAIRWSLFEEPAAKGQDTVSFQESFVSTSWGEHLRQHHRATMEDREIFAAAYRMDPEGRPRIRHLVAAWEEHEALIDRLWE
ncbi:MAG TPA: MFS transporter [Holophagaceae bacterium]|jgi:MFS family permease|nr:MFS transporter [Holophagaceae bacterium]